MAQHAVEKTEKLTTVQNTLASQTLQNKMKWDALNDKYDELYKKFDAFEKKHEALEIKFATAEKDLGEVIGFLKREFPVDEEEGPPALGAVHAADQHELDAPDSMPPLERVYTTYQKANEAQRALPLIPPESMTKLIGAVLREGYTGSEYARDFPHPNAPS
jgi:hypothetical protein